MNKKQTKKIWNKLFGINCPKCRSQNWQATTEEGILLELIVMQKKGVKESELKCFFECLDCRHRWRRKSLARFDENGEYCSIE